MTASCGSQCCGTRNHRGSYAPMGIAARSKGPSRSPISGNTGQYLQCGVQQGYRSLWGSRDEAAVSRVCWTAFAAAGPSGREPRAAASIARRSSHMRRKTGNRCIVARCSAAACAPGVASEPEAVLRAAHGEAAPQAGLPLPRHSHAPVLHEQDRNFLSRRLFTSLIGLDVQAPMSRATEMCLMRRQPPQTTTRPQQEPQPQDT